jgi:hypothetical protein
MNDRTWELVEKHLESGVYKIIAAQDSAPSKEALLAFGREVGCALPEEFIAHSSGSYGGLYVEVKEELWPRPKKFDVVPFWSFLYGMFTFNLAEGIPEFMELRAGTKALSESSGQLLVPCLKVIGDANKYCFNKDGRLGLWDHETNEVSSGHGSFFEVLDHELGELQKRKLRKCSNV